MQCRSSPYNCRGDAYVGRPAMLHTTNQPSWLPSFALGCKINGINGTKSESQGMALVVFLGDGPHPHAYEAVCHVVESIAGDEYGLILNRKWMLDQHPDKTPPILVLYNNEDDSKLTRGISI